MTTTGGAGFVASEDDILRFLSALATVIGIAWSIWEKRQASRAVPAAPAASGPGAGGASGLWAWLALGLWASVAGMVTGCRTADAVSHITPARVYSVVRWGAYTHVQSADAPTRASVRSALPEMKALSGSATDATTAAAAIQAAGVTFLTTPEGLLRLPVHPVFEDLFHGQKVSLTDQKYAQAALCGAVSGFEMGLGARSAFLGDELRAAAIADR